MTAETDGLWEVKRVFIYMSDTASLLGGGIMFFLLFIKLNRGKEACMDAAYTKWTGIAHQDLYFSKLSPVLQGSKSENDLSQAPLTAEFPFSFCKWEALVHSWESTAKATFLLHHFCEQTG